MIAGATSHPFDFVEAKSEDSGTYELSTSDGEKVLGVATFTVEVLDPARLPPPRLLLKFRPKE